MNNEQQLNLNTQEYTRKQMESKHSKDLTVPMD